MMTRPLDADYRAGCAGAPPPLHVTDDHPGANWYPLARPALIPQPTGPIMVMIPSPAPFGDDPLDPSAQTVRRYATMGMIGRLNFAVPQNNIDAQGVRR